MVFHMKTTLEVSEPVMARLRKEAARSGKTMSQLVESALRLLLYRKPRAQAPPALPTFHGGRALVDVASREELYRVMEEGDRSEVARQTRGTTRTEKADVPG